jgi:hypothetical protein
MGVLAGSLEATFSEGAGWHSSGIAISLGFLRITERFRAGISCKIYIHVYIEPRSQTLSLVLNMSDRTRV